ncbi:MAG: hypothetical protein IAE95_07350 [Chitinophagaceae bacterium]|nr:hypothetical protein [Chitinophagaceae bacterium]
MNRSSVRIIDGLKELSRRPYEVVSGKVVGGSIDSDANTMSVVLSANGLEIKDVLLKATSDGTDGVIGIPEDGSDVVIGSIDGPGQWVLLQASSIAKWEARLHGRSVVITPEAIKIDTGLATVKVAEKVTVRSGTEDLYTLLRDLLDSIKLITVTTPAGPSSVPVNVAMFDAISLRLNNLLTA